MPILLDPHVCPHEQAIGQFKKTIDRIDNEVFGNGRKGLSKEFTELKVEFMTVKDDIKKLATSYAALAKSEISKDAMEKATLELENKKLEERKRRSSIIQRFGTIFGIIFGAGTLLYIILDHVGNH